ncbi:MAG: hypothetical protein IPJ69_14300 [Deltaproteobacteria bacterium]|nr:MAG: hypothetical protein IPJ69_14300 [Deltaproteobacteria bacterium]
MPPNKIGIVPKIYETLFPEGLLKSGIINPIKRKNEIIKPYKAQLKYFPFIFSVIKSKKKQSPKAKNEKGCDIHAAQQKRENRSGR